MVLPCSFRTGAVDLTMAIWTSVRAMLRAVVEERWRDAWVVILVRRWVEHILMM